MHSNELIGLIMTEYQNTKIFLTISILVLMGIKWISIFSSGFLETFQGIGNKGCGTEKIPVRFYAIAYFVIIL